MCNFGQSERKRTKRMPINSVAQKSEAGVVFLHRAETCKKEMAESCEDASNTNKESLIREAISFAAKKLGYDSLREHQVQGAASILGGKDTFVAKPTGSGKSLIFFLVPYATDFMNQKTIQPQTKPGCHFVIVISPLVSLMKDQIQILTEKNVMAINLEDPSTTPTRLKQNDYSFLYCSPESILRKFRSVFRSKEFQERLACIVVDESHCIIKWGITSKKVKGFRDCYADISQLRSLLRKPTPFAALTATATVKVGREIINNLELHFPTRIVSVPERPNVYLDLLKTTENSIEQTFHWLVQKIKSDKENCSRYLVFCRNHSHVRTLYSFFDKELGSLFNVNSLPFQMFHGSTDDDTKAYITRSFSDPNGEVRVLFATIAFGMGINCQNLHNIIHYGPPSSLDDLCQETGRAGREGVQSFATLIVYPHYAKMGPVSKEMKHYVENTTICRRKLMLEHFPGSFKEVLPKHLCCDICACSCKCGFGGETCSVKSLNICRDEIEGSVTTSRSDNAHCVTKTLIKVNEEGLDALYGRLESMRSHLCSDLSTIYTGVDMATGFPHSVIQSIVSSVDFIHSSDDIKTNFLLFNKNLADEIMDNINSVREQFGNVDIETTSPHFTRNSPEKNPIPCMPSNETDHEEDSDPSCDESLDFEELNSKYRCKLAEESSSNTDSDVEFP